MIAERARKQKPEPTWQIAELFPLQGEWSEEEYLALDTNRLIEFSAGKLEFLPMPTLSHQRIVFFLQRLLWNYLMAGNLGEVFAAPLRVYLGPRKYREPDVVVVLNKNLAQQDDRYVTGVDLVLEVVSPDNPERDYERKRKEYERAGIPEYWIIDPQEKKIVVLVLADGGYRERGTFRTGEQATSQVLLGFAVAVSDVFASAAR